MEASRAWKEVVDVQYFMQAYATPPFSEAERCQSYSTEQMGSVERAELIGQVIADVSMSLDGCIAGPDDRIGQPRVRALIALTTGCNDSIHL